LKQLVQLVWLVRQELLPQPLNRLLHQDHVDVLSLVGPLSLPLSVLLVDCQRQMLPQAKTLWRPRLAVWKRSRLPTSGLLGLGQNHFVEGKSTDPNSLGEGQLRWNHAVRELFRRWLR
jgi:hypothetical protein